MKPSLLLAALASLSVTAPAVAQKKIAPSVDYKTAPSVEYRTPPPETLDKNYGLPTFGLPGSEPARKRTATATPQMPERPDAFQPWTGMRPAPDTETSDTPDFFSASTDFTAPKPRKGASTMETPLFTTSEGMSTDDSPFDRSTPTDSAFDRSRSSDTLAGGPWGGGDTNADNARRRR
jgi:hypothetical protein